MKESALRCLSSFCEAVSESQSWVILKKKKFISLRAGQSKIEGLNLVAPSCFVICWEASNEKRACTGERGKGPSSFFYCEPTPAVTNPFLP
jgi:hypothetical protein